MPIKTKMNEYERFYNDQNYQKIIGLDEAGRGCIAGPLVCAGVIFEPGYDNPLIKDSKQLTPMQRAIAARIIKQDCIAYNVVVLNPQVVDEMNPKQASRVGMQECVKTCNVKPDFALVDFEKLDLAIPSLSIVKGDQKSVSIAAASILAKEVRDALIVQYDHQYPEYKFRKNKGYLTLEHRQALEKYGPIKGLHRFSYKPIKKDA